MEVQWSNHRADYFGSSRESLVKRESLSMVSVVLDNMIGLLLQECCEQRKLLQDCLLIAQSAHTGEQTAMTNSDNWTNALVLGKIRVKC